MRLLACAVFLIAGCRSPAEAPLPDHLLVLDTEGRVHLAGLVFDIPSDADALVACLEKRESDTSLEIVSERGTPGVHVMRLAELLERAGVDDWRMSLRR